MIKTFTKEQAAEMFNMRPKTFAEHARKHGLYAKAGRKVIYYKHHQRKVSRWPALNTHS